MFGIFQVDATGQLTAQPPLLDEGRGWLHGRFTSIYAASECWAPTSGLTQDQPINFIRKQRICNTENSLKKISQQNELFFSSPNHLRLRFLRYSGKLAFSPFRSNAILKRFFHILFLFLLPKADHRKVLCLSWFLVTSVLQNFPSCSLKLVLGYPIIPIPFSALFHLFTFLTTALVRWLWNNCFSRDQIYSYYYVCKKPQQEKKP